MVTLNRKLLLLLSGTVIALGAAGGYFYFSENPPTDHATPAAAGRKLGGEWELEELGGKKSQLAAYQGKVVLLNFWAGWCGPCLEEMPGLYSLYGKLHSKGFEIVAMNMDDDPYDGQRALKRAAGDAPFPLFKGMNSPLSEHFSITGLPFTVILDRKGEIRYANAGEVDWNGPQALRLIEGLL